MTLVARLSLALPWLLAGCGSCGQSPVAVPEAQVPVEEAQDSTAELQVSSAPGPDVSAWPYCEAGKLPRITQQSLAPAGLETLVSASKRGSVAVIWDGTHAEVVEDCRLEGSYRDAPDRDNRGGHYWTNSRLLFRSDEVSGPCSRATHLVGAFAAGPAPPASGATPRSLRGVLVPLPCPSLRDPEPAPGCIGRGLTGAERAQRAASIVGDPDVPRQRDVSERLQVFALVPDHYWGIEWLRRIDRRPDIDAIGEHAAWIAAHYDLDDRVSPHSARLLPPEQRHEHFPTVAWSSGPPYKVRGAPAFLGCFKDVVDPAVSEEVDF